MKLALADKKRGAVPHPAGHQAGARQPANGAQRRSRTSRTRSWRPSSPARSPTTPIRSSASTNESRHLRSSAGPDAGAAAAQPSRRRAAASGDRALTVATPTRAFTAAAPLPYISGVIRNCQAFGGRPCAPKPKSSPRPSASRSPCCGGIFDWDTAQAAPGRAEQARRGSQALERPAGGAEGDARSARRSSARSTPTSSSSATSTTPSR